MQDYQNDSLMLFEIPDNYKQLSKLSQLAKSQASFQTASFNLSSSTTNQQQVQENMYCQTELHNECKNRIRVVVQNAEHTIQLIELNIECNRNEIFETNAQIEILNEYQQLITIFVKDEFYDRVNTIIRQEINNKSKQQFQIAKSNNITQEQCKQLELNLDLSTDSSIDLQFDIELQEPHSTAQPTQLVQNKLYLEQHNAILQLANNLIYSKQYSSINISSNKLKYYQNIQNEKKKLQMQLNHLIAVESIISPSLTVPGERLVTIFLNNLPSYSGSLLTDCLQVLGYKPLQIQQQIQLICSESELNSLIAVLNQIQIEQQFLNYSVQVLVNKITVQMKTFSLLYLKIFKKHFEEYFENAFGVEGGNNIQVQIFNKNIEIVCSSKYIKVVLEAIDIEVDGQKLVYTIQ
ncbi:Hypothetical_protein [Hexamita inflata]|uniref:Hypothetical_protein n=1 Tax=Hexamita inflata TaxID=28002 RepID=A0AA86S224_9EUKA|nr:Hypothetical protein HINF_LOCUS64285 [Hexamita inflata]